MGNSAYAAGDRLEKRPGDEAEARDALGIFWWRGQQVGTLDPSLAVLSTGDFWGQAAPKLLAALGRQANRGTVRKLIRRPWHVLSANANLEPTARVCRGRSFFANRCQRLRRGAAVNIHISLKTII